MKLFVDVGNSRLKWARQDGGAWKIGSTLPTRQPDLRAILTETWRDLPVPERVRVCSVVGDGAFETVGAVVRQLWQRTADAFVATGECAGVRNGYRNPATLGGDRWAALIGAHRQHTGPLCVVDCGTAVTVDALTADGEFVGGVIFPGIALLGLALAGGTFGAGATGGDGSDSLARTTADAVAAGTRFGLAGAVERLVGEHRRQLGGDMKVILTGGDAATLIPLLGFETVYVPDLVLRGLAVAEGAC